MLLSAARPATCARGTYHPVVKGYRDGFTGRGRLFQSRPDILRESDQEGRPIRVRARGGDLRDAGRQRHCAFGSRGPARRGEAMWRTPACV